MKQALQWLRDNPTKKPTTAARLHYISNGHSVQQAWRRERKRAGRPKEKGQGGAGWNRILRPDQHSAMIRYAVDQGTDGGMRATKQMLFNCAVYLRFQEKKPAPTWRWFQKWLKNTPELHTIKTKPIARHRVDMHTENDLRDWFETEYRPALESKSRWVNDSMSTRSPPLPSLVQTPGTISVVLMANIIKYVGPRYQNYVSPSKDIPKMTNISNGQICIS